MAKQTQPSVGPKSPDDARRPSLFCRFATEFELMAQDCSAVQSGMSHLFERLDKAHLQEELHLIQLIDRVQQTLTDLATLARKLKSEDERDGIATQLDISKHSHVLILDSLRERLTSDLAPSDAVDDAVNGDITWL